MKNKFLLLIAAFALPLCMWANNIRVKLNSYNPTTKQLNISLAWDNSWHDGSGQFRDAAWLFVKYKDITNSEWQHAVLANPGSANNVPASIADTLNTPGVQFDVQAKKTGITTGPVTGYMVRRQKGTSAATQNNPEYAGVYNVAMSFNVVVTLPAGVTLANPEFRVYALEMVDIPQGSFWAGDGSSTSYIKTNLTTNAPLNVTSVGGGTGLTATTYLNNMHIAVSSTYPNGVAEYFIMKYELSNEGYCEFMNTLTRAQQNILAPGYDFVNKASGSISYGSPSFALTSATFTSLTEPAVFGCDANRNGIFNEANDGQNNGVLVEKMIDVLAYLDWAGLRPMTGYEYEKACRGPLVPVQGEYAWGNTTKNEVTLDYDRYGANETSTTVVNGPGSYAGTRNGAFAKPTGSTRLNSGGSYYGVMELSNSCFEPHTGYGYGLAWSLWTGTHGDGIVNNDGYAGAELTYTAFTVSKIEPFGVPGSTLPLFAQPTDLLYRSSGPTSSFPAQQGIRGVIK